MKLVDSHCHLDFAEFDADRDQVVEQCRGLGIVAMVVPGVVADDWPRVIETCRRYPGLFPALGLHPMFMDRHRPEDVARLREAIVQYSPVAVGEVGLDFYHGDSGRDAQLALMQRQIQLAEEFGLPLILHVRKAHDEMLALLRKSRVTGGVIHAFSGSLQQAQQYIGLGFLLGIGGSITYPRAKRLRAIVTQLPLTALILETDAPDMPPAGGQGRRNQPQTILQVAETLATLRGEPLERVAQQTTANLAALLGVVFE